MNLNLKQGVIEELRILAENLPLEKRLAEVRSSLIIAMICDSTETPEEVRTILRALHDLPRDVQDADLTRLSLQAIRAVECRCT